MNIHKICKKQAELKHSMTISCNTHSKPIEWKIKSCIYGTEYKVTGPVHFHIKGNIILGNELRFRMSQNSSATF